MKISSLNINLKIYRRQIFLTILGLNLFGLLMVYEASSIFAYHNYGDALYFFRRQFLYFLMGLVFFFFTLLINIKDAVRISRSLLLLNIVLLFLVLVFGKSSGGAKRWLYFFHLRFQPSELLKITLTLYFADYINRKKNLIKYFREGILPLACIMGIICILLVFQPDLGMVLFWFIFFCLILFLHRAKLAHLAFILFVSFLLLVVFVSAYPSRAKRIKSFLNPFNYAKSEGYQLVQSQIAFGEGGLFGVGIGKGRQKFLFLPAAHTDFIFSIIAEEFGLAGSLGLLFLFFFLFQRMFKIILVKERGQEKSILLAIFLIFFLEITVNIGVSCGFLPTKGLTLPFISYGGSSLIVHYILLGMFFNASKQKSQREYRSLPYKNNPQIF